MKWIYKVTLIFSVAAIVLIPLAAASLAAAERNQESGATASPIDPLFDKLTNFGGLGVAVWILYSLTKADRARHDEAMREERKLFKESLALIVKKVGERLDHVEDKIDLLFPKPKPMP
jgi:hypothetical protein